LNETDRSHVTYELLVVCHQIMVDAAHFKSRKRAREVPHEKGLKKSIETVKINSV